MPAAADPFLADALELLPLIRSDAAEAEHLGHVTDRVAEAFRASRLPRMLVSADIGGGGARIPQTIPVCQALSSADGSTGWALTFAMTGVVFGNFLPRATYDALFSNPGNGLAGAFSPMSVAADAVEGGFRVTGKSSYNSAHRFASHLMMGGVVRRNGQVSMNGPVPEFRGFLLPKSEVTVIPNWPVSAMIATESDDAQVTDVFVPESHTFSLMAPSPWREGTERTLPLVSGLGVSIAAIGTGVARGALDVFREMAMTKIPGGTMSRLADQAGPQIALAEAEGLWQAADLLLRGTIDAVWKMGDVQESFEPADLAKLRSAMVTAVRLSRQAVETVRDFAGMNAVVRGSQFERFSRDMGAVTQHVAVSASRYENVGRVLMGLPQMGPIL
ncbi:MAG: hypothetical protein ABI577_18880 [bacterium]